MSISTPSACDLNHDADLLEQSTKRNDKYTVRRILDVHNSYFRMKKTSNPNCAPPPLIIDPPPTTPRRKYVSIPAIFLNILHLAIESNAIDVLRICLKYGCDPNEPGTNLKRALLNLDTNKFESSLPMAASSANKAKQLTARYLVKCNFCNRKNQKVDKADPSSTPTGPSRVHALHKQMHQMFMEAEDNKLDKKDQIVSWNFVGIFVWIS